MKKTIVFVVMASMLTALFAGCQSKVPADIPPATVTETPEVTEQIPQDTVKDLTAEPTTELPEPTAAPVEAGAFITQVRSASIADTITFGCYEQDNNLENGAEDIEWYVLAKEEGKVLLLSRYALDCKEYDESIDTVTWENCTLRSWLNSEFYQMAFSEEERSYISEMLLENADNTDFYDDYFVEGGNDTQDKVFLLSRDEISKYFYPNVSASSETTDIEINPMSLTKVTEYAKAQGAAVYNESESSLLGTTEYDGNGIWWLRSPGNNNIEAFAIAYHGYFGSVYYRTVDCCVRPAIWVAYE